jgi:hypothetical protein
MSTKMEGGTDAHNVGTAKAKCSGEQARSLDNPPNLDVQPTGASPSQIEILANGPARPRKLTGGPR